MAKRKYNIRWREADEKELQRVVKNFNAKLTRLAKKDPKNAAALPERVSAAELRAMIKTRQDLNRELNALRRFSERGAETLVEIPDNYYNLKITKWQMKEMNRRGVIVNENREIRRKEVEKMEATSRGVGLDYSVEHTMSDEEKAALQPINVFTEFQSRDAVNQKHRTLRKQSMVEYWTGRDEALRRGYIRAMTENLGTTADVMEIVEAINNMDVAEFRNTFQKEQSKFSLNYPGDKDKVKENTNALRAIWMPEHEAEPIDGILIDADEDDDFPW
jgi:hypothetical protein